MSQKIITKLATEENTKGEIKEAIRLLNSQTETINATNITDQLKKRKYETVRKMQIDVVTQNDQIQGVVQGTTKTLTVKEASTQMEIEDLIEHIVNGIDGEQNFEYFKI